MITPSRLARAVRLRPTRLADLHFVDQLLVASLVPHRYAQPVLTLCSLYLVAITPVSARVLDIVEQNERVDAADQVEIPFPWNVIGLQHSHFLLHPRPRSHRVKPGVSLSINCRQAKKNRASARLLQFPRQLLERDEPSGFGVPPLAVSSNFAGEGARPFRQQLLNSLRSQSSRALDRQLRLRCKHHEAASSCHSEAQVDICRQHRLNVCPYWRAQYGLYAANIATGAGADFLAVGV